MSKTFKGVPLYSQDFVKGKTTGAKMSDTTRDWYFLSPEDAKRVSSGEIQMKPYDMDPSELNVAGQQLNDWRKALNYGQDWKWSTAVPYGMNVIDSVRCTRRKRAASSWKKASMCGQVRNSRLIECTSADS